MQLSEIGITGAKYNLIENKGIASVEGLLHKEPLKYYDFSETFALDITDSRLLDKIDQKMPVAVIGIMTELKKSYDKNRKGPKSLIQIRVKENISGKMLFVNFMGAYNRLKELESYIDKEVIVGGVLHYSPEYSSFSMLNPYLFSDNIILNKRVVPVYGNVKGIPREYYEEKIKEAVTLKGDLDYLPKKILEKYKLPSFKEAARMMHMPKTLSEVEMAKKRFIFDDLTYFACKLEEQSKELNTFSPYKAEKRNIMNQFIASQRFQLTDDQKQSIESAYEQMSKSKRVSALIQGDVGCGKTVIAFSLMVLAAENGFQSVLMAPTSVLANQHYKELSEATEKYGFKTAFLSNELKAKEKRMLLSGIENGEYHFIVGTHSVVSKKVVYQNLGLMITDEEHKFGVIQRDSLVKRFKSGVHNIIMSATPIPRTLANTIYGNNTDVFSIKQLPNGRKPIQTAICKTDKVIFEFMEKEIRKGRQCYVICPLIEKAEDGTRLDGVSSVEEYRKIYEKHFDVLGIRMGVITGKTSKTEMASIMDRFKANELQILMATQVIEVGVNVPNATCIVITGAERFGLATLHQLRGRVGRGEYQSYCILQRSLAASENSGSNLEIMCQETDGLKIATEDLKHRGTGSLIGTKQSGNDKFVKLMLQYPNMYNVVKRIAKELCQDKTGHDIIKIYEEYYMVEA